MYGCATLREWLRHAARTACSRAIALSPVYDPFVERLIEATKSLNIGAAELPSMTVGPVIDATAQKRIQEYIETGKQEAELALEMPAPDTGYFVGPTIFKDVAPWQKNCPGINLWLAPAVGVRSRVGGDEGAEFPGSVRDGEWHQLCPDGWVIFSHAQSHRTSSGRI